MLFISQDLGRSNNTEKQIRHLTDSLEDLRDEF